jgi:hypothetical protein
MGFRGGFELIESLARFLEFSKRSPKALSCSTAFVKEELQETLLNAKVISKAEDYISPAACHFRLDLFQTSPGNSSLPSGSLY